MLDVCLLGTGGTVPLPQRWLTSCLIRYQGSSLLIDSGEGTQITLHKEGYSCKQIDAILLTHYHADHTAGLPGLLLSMAKSDRTEPVWIIGPKGLKNFIDGVMKIAMYIPFELHLLEYEEQEFCFAMCGMEITAFRVRHSVPCWGYEINVERRPRFDAERAKQQNIPLRLWNPLQKGETVEYEGKVYTPDMVLGKPRKGLKLVYVTDTRPVPAIASHAQNADLLIAEGMYGEAEKLEKAKLNRHMMMQEAASIAKEANVRELWLTHYSPSMPYPAMYKEEVRAIFPNTIISKDGQKTDLAFTEE